LARRAQGEAAAAAAAMAELAEAAAVVGLDPADAGERRTRGVEVEGRVLHETVNAFCFVCFF